MSIKNKLFKKINNNNVRSDVEIIEYDDDRLWDLDTEWLDDLTWFTFTKKGKMIEHSFWDWACMRKLTCDYIDELSLMGLSESEKEDEAESIFWRNVRAYNPKEFEECFYGRELNAENFVDVLGGGGFDELRFEYLESTGVYAFGIKNSDIFEKKLTQKDIFKIYRSGRNRYRRRRNRTRHTAN